MQDEVPSQDDGLSQAEDPLRHNETLPGLIPLRRPSRVLQRHLAAQHLRPPRRLPILCVRLVRHYSLLHKGLLFAAIDKSLKMFQLSAVDMEILGRQVHCSHTSIEAGTVTGKSSPTRPQLDRIVDCS